MHKTLLAYYSDLSISKKLRFMLLYTIIIAGSLSIVIVSIYKYANAKFVLEKETKTLSKIVAHSITSAVIFNDNEYIDSTLSSLSHQDRILHAFVIDNDLTRIAHYHQNEILIKEDMLKSLHTSEEGVWDGIDLYTAVPIKNDNDEIASLILVSSLYPFLMDIIKEILILLGIIGFSLLLSFKFRVVMRDSILTPILELNDKANEIIQTNNLTQKVQVYNNDEVGALAKSFNTMLETIKLSDEKLRKSNEELEKRVDLRTHELQELNVSLDKRVKDEMNKRTEQEKMLIQQSRFAAMGEMIGNIAHQWRQPLNALGLLIQNIEITHEMDMIDDAYVSRTVEKGNRLTKSMSQTIDDFRNFFKPNKDAMIFSVLATVESSLDMVRASFTNSMIDITYEVDENICLKGFPSEFSQVLLNILNNARDALVENNITNKKIFIRAVKNNLNACIIIEDNAGGVPEKILKNVFDPYFTTKDEGKGTGIGLYMSKTIIENNMHGKLSVENSAHGAKFSILMKLEVCNERIV